VAYERLRNETEREHYHCEAPYTTYFAPLPGDAQQECDLESLLQKLTSVAWENGRAAWYPNLFESWPNDIIREYGI